MYATLVQTSLINCFDLINQCINCIRYRVPVLFTDNSQAGKTGKENAIRQIDRSRWRDIRNIKRSGCGRFARPGHSISWC